MANSILTETKKVLGVAEDYTAFDADILMHINSVFSTLTQLGIGPTNGFSIEDKEATWDAFLGSDLNLNQIKSYMYLRVRLLFDPPGTSFLGDALDKQRIELEWRLHVYREGRDWVNPTPLPSNDFVLDGGPP